MRFVICRKMFTKAVAFFGRVKKDGIFASLGRKVGLIPINPLGQTL